MKTTTATKTQWIVDVQAVVGGDGGAYVVMEHCHGTYVKTPTKIEADTSF